MRRVVLDTNVYVDWINRRGYEDVVFERDTVKYLSAVVLMELRAGAFSRRDRRLVRGLEDAFDRTRRILSPSRTVFAEAGDIFVRYKPARATGSGAVIRLQTMC